MTDHTTDDTDEYDDAPRVRVPTRRPSAGTRKPAAGRAPSRGRRGAEVSLGAVAAAAGVGFGLYAVAVNVLGWPREVSIGVACYAAGTCSGGVVWPLWHAARLALATFFHPKGRS